MSNKANKMSDIERILRHMLHSKYVFFRPRTIAQYTNLEERRVAEIIESMEKNGVVRKVSIPDKSVRYYLTPASKWILENLWS